MLEAVKKGRAIKSFFDEDCLTSIVFGIFKYLPYKYLKRILSDAVNIDGRRLGEALTIPEEAPDFDFWHYYSDDEQMGRGCEPDLILSWPDMVIVEESKYNSPKSGSGYETIEDEEKQKKIIIDQLAREYLLAKRLAKQGNFFPNFVVLYITNQLLFPEDEIRESIKSLSEDEMIRSRIFWLNWRRIAKELKEISTSTNEEALYKKMSKDLYDALDSLGNIHLPFSGFLYEEREMPRIDELTASVKRFYHPKPYWEFGDLCLSLSLIEAKRLFYNHSLKSY